MARGCAIVATAMQRCGAAGLEGELVQIVVSVGPMVRVLEGAQGQLMAMVARAVEAKWREEEEEEPEEI